MRGIRSKVRWFKRDQQPLRTYARHYYIMICSNSSEPVRSSQVSDYEAKCLPVYEPPHLQRGRHARQKCLPQHWHRAAQDLQRKWTRSSHKKSGWAGVEQPSHQGDSIVPSVGFQWSLVTRSAFLRISRVEISRTGSGTTRPSGYAPFRRPPRRQRGAKFAFRSGSAGPYNRSRCARSRAPGGG